MRTLCPLQLFCGKQCISWQAHQSGFQEAESAGPYIEIYDTELACRIVRAADQVQNKGKIMDELARQKLLSSGGISLLS